MLLTIRAELRAFLIQYLLFSVAHTHAAPKTGPAKCGRLARSRGELTQLFRAKETTAVDVSSHIYAALLTLFNSRLLNITERFFATVFTPEILPRYAYLGAKQRG